jgi:putative ABC transport system permease protein
MKKDRHPPRIAGWFVRRMFPDRGGSSILGDMIETYRCVADDKGFFWARIWFWSQCVKAIPHFLIDEFYWRIHMFKNYLLVTVRNLKKNSTYSLLNIIGLAVGLTAFILIALYVQYELSFDKYHENADRFWENLWLWPYWR